VNPEEVFIPGTDEQKNKDIHALLTRQTNLSQEILNSQTLRAYPGHPGHNRRNASDRQWNTMNLKPNARLLRRPRIPYDTAQVFELTAAGEYYPRVATVGDLQQPVAIIYSPQRSSSDSGYRTAVGDRNAANGLNVVSGSVVNSYSHLILSTF